MRRIAVLFLLFLSGGVSWHLLWNPDVSEALREQTQQGPGTVIDFDEMAPFRWDRVFVFGPYTHNERINECLGFHWAGASGSNIDWAEHLHLVVFVDGNRVVHWFEHNRIGQHLDWLPRRGGYARSEARFVVTQSGQLLPMKGGQPWFPMDR